MDCPVKYRHDFQIVAPAAHPVTIEIAVGETGKIQVNGKPITMSALQACMQEQASREAREKPTAPKPP